MSLRWHALGIFIAQRASQQSLRRARSARIVDRIRRDDRGQYDSRRRRNARQTAVSSLRRRTIRLCSIKPTRGLVSRSGIIPITSTQDTAGPLGRTVKDTAILLDQLWGRDPFDSRRRLANPFLDYKFAEACERDVSGLKIGALSFSNRPYEEANQKTMVEAKAVLKQL
ncbi:MAG: amidase [Bacillus subtilis]|nr:amidase [Bacillus subtilis]